MDIKISDATIAFNERLYKDFCNKYENCSDCPYDNQLVDCKSEYMSNMAYKDGFKDAKSEILQYILRLGE